MVIGGQFLVWEGKCDHYTNTEFQAFAETVHSASHFSSATQKTGKKFGARLASVSLGLNF